MLYRCAGQAADWLIINKNVYAIYSKYINILSPSIYRCNKYNQLILPQNVIISSSVRVQQKPKQIKLFSIKLKPCGNRSHLFMHGFFIT